MNPGGWAQGWALILRDLTSSPVKGGVSRGCPVLAVPRQVGTPDAESREQALRFNIDFFHISKQTGNSNLLLPPMCQTLYALGL